MAVAAKSTQPEWTQWKDRTHRKCSRSWSAQTSPTRVKYSNGTSLASAFCVVGVNPVANVLQRVHSCLLVRSG